MQKSMIRLLSIADVISIANAIFGVLSIIFLFSSLSEDLRLRFSFSFILVAIILDGLDGFAARKMGKSEIGGYLEAMADVTSFVIAPVIFTYFIYSNIMDYFLLIILIIFLFSGIIRLASFHTLKNDKFFAGFPAPASALLLLILAYFNIDFYYILIATLILAVAMISNIKFAKPGIKTDSVAAILIIFTLVIDKSYYGIAPILLFIAVLSYSIGGAIYIKFIVKK